ncbi:hypothetical protein KU75_24930 [Pectobacterium odoriferum]|uniref:Uncharacterized protein n=1 Tax=Pectobacterium odoriferum TaxID=78398 RepID=A0ABR4VI74_9GAMM|nr:hypothetical protein KU75_24930 [Pectobacterium odoriferum]POE16494.1 hypothetical protein BV918_16265 [Pectobacterium odoriferum]
MGVGARHVPLADNPRIGIQPPLPAAAVRGDNGDQLLALFVVLVTPGVIVNKTTKTARYYTVGYARTNLL